MKNLLKLLLAVTVIVTISFASCSKHEPTPVEQYVDLLDNGLAQAEHMDADDPATFKAILSPEGARELIKENADYVLTPGDKEKLKETMDKVIRFAFEKTMKYDNLTEEEKKNVDMQMGIAIEGANNVIEKAQTFGQVTVVR